MENMKPILWPPAARSALGKTEGGRELGRVLTVKSEGKTEVEDGNLWVGGGFGECLGQVSKK